MSNKKESIEYALHAYDTYWEYYKKTLDERNQILNNYLVFVGIPISIISIFIEKIKNNIDNYFNIAILSLGIIFLLGIVIYNSYIVESFVSQRYLQRIKHITEYLINNFDKDYNNIFKEAYKVDNLFLDKKNSLKHRINKGFIIIIINTMISIIMLLMFFRSDIKWYYIVLSFTVSIVIHSMIFIYQKQHI